MAYSIDTNPEALRGIAAGITKYTNEQYELISGYLSQMTSEAPDIQVQSYQLCLEAIGEWLKRMDELRTEGDAFVAFLNAKADALDSLK